MKAAVMACVGLLMLGGCVPVKNDHIKVQRSTEPPAYDCKKHSIDKICEVPVNGKVVLYCHAGPWPKVVRYREDCK